MFRLAGHPADVSQRKRARGLHGDVVECSTCQAVGLLISRPYQVPELHLDTFVVEIQDRLIRTPEEVSVDNRTMTTIGIPASLLCVDPLGHAFDKIH